MWISPIVTRELRVGLRQSEAVRSRFWLAAGGTALSALLLLLGSAGISTWGTLLHQYLYYVALYCGVIRPAQACVGLFSEERRDQTLELLYLTGMSSAELFAGKLAAGLIMASYDLLALMPLLALPYLAGGMSVQLFWATLLSLPALLLLSVALASLASVLTTDDGAAFVLTIALMALLCLAIPLPYAMGKLLTAAPPFSSHWLRLSPFWMAWLVQKRFAVGQSMEFWTAAAMTLLWALLALGLAAFLLGRRWRSARELTGAVRPFWQKLLGRFEGNPHHEPACLEASPFQWLVQQDHRSLFIAWSGLAGIGVLWLLGLIAWPRQWPAPINLYLTSLILILLLSHLQVYCAAKRLGEDRHSGMLELLLTTPQSNEQIIDGQTAAVEAQLRPMRRACLGLFCVFALIGLLVRPWTGPALVTYLTIWIALGYWSQCPQRGSTRLALWVALNTGRPGYAAWRISTSSMGKWFWILFNLQSAVRDWGRSSFEFPSGSFLEMAIVVGAAFLALLIGDAYRRMPDPNDMRQKLVRWLRIIAQDPVPERNDPRLKKWKKVTERLPPSQEWLEPKT